MSATHPYSAQYGSPHNDSSSPHSDPSRSIVPTGIFVPATHVITGLPQPARQKGRPRKRKPKDIEAFTANIGRLLISLFLEIRLPTIKVASCGQAFYDHSTAHLEVPRNLDTGAIKYATAVDFIWPHKIQKVL